MYANVIYTTDICSRLNDITSEFPDNKIFILTDSNTSKLCLPKLELCNNFQNFQHIEISSGEESKDITSVVKVWQFLSDNGADRRSLFISLGGGMITDLGSFVASTFKRGMTFMNIPTTLLSQVDASVGGKTGFNFNGLKNEIGVINQPNTVIIDPTFLGTITDLEFISGFAEMIKHGVIASPNHLKDLTLFIAENFKASAEQDGGATLQLNREELDYSKLTTLIENSVAIKEHFVHEDPYEHGVRKALNFGHTIGHAIESIAIREGAEMPHGIAVAFGMAAELRLANATNNLPNDQLESTLALIKSIYGQYHIAEEKHQEIHTLMTHDKKNEGGNINITLIKEIGSVEIDCHCSKEEIVAAL